jgi:hypothetical protein
MAANASRIVTVDLIDEITVTADPILATTIGIDVITAATTDATIDVVKMTSTAKTTTARSGHLCHRPREATPMVHSRRQTTRSTSMLVVAKRSKPTDRLDQTPGRSGTSTLKIHDLYGGLNSQSLSPGKIIGPTFPTPEPIRWSLTP